MMAASSWYCRVKLLLVKFKLLLKIPRDVVIDGGGLFRPVIVHVPPKVLELDTGAVPVEVDHGPQGGSGVDPGEEDS